MVEVIDNDFKEVVDKIKDEIRTTNIKTMQQVNNNLKLMKRFYNEYKNCDEKVPQVVAHLPWRYNIAIWEN